MSEPIQSISQGNYILQGTVATSAGIVGDGSTQNPLRVASDYIITTKEYIGNVTVSNTTASNVSGYISKEGYRPVAWVPCYNFAAIVNLNQENTTLSSNNTLYFQGYAQRIVGTGNLNTTFNLFVTWVKAQ